MTTILTTCRNCGTLDLTIDEIMLEPGHYRFECPECYRPSILPISPKIIAILVTVGVKYAPITEDEIDLFAMELDLREGIER